MDMYTCSHRCHWPNSVRDVIKRWRSIRGSGAERGTKWTLPLSPALSKIQLIKLLTKINSETIAQDHQYGCKMLRVGFYTIAPSAWLFHTILQVASHWLRGLSVRCWQNAISVIRTFGFTKPSASQVLATWKRNPSNETKSPDTFLSCLFGCLTYTILWFGQAVVGLL